MKLFIIILLLFTHDLYSQVIWGIDTDSPVLSAYDGWDTQLLTPEISTSQKENIFGFDYAYVINSGETFIFYRSNPPVNMSSDVIDYLNTILGEYYQRDSVFGGYDSHITYNWRTKSKAVVVSVHQSKIKVTMVRLDEK